MGDSDCRIQEQWHSQPRQIRMICVGAGASGLLLAYKVQKFMRNIDLICYEKNPSIGGSWYENRYPGCACDVPAHAYTYTFEPNPEWSSFYASSEEIKKYFEDFADKYDLRKYVKLNSRVKEAVWNDKQGIYNVTVQSGDEMIEDWAHIVVNGTGFLNCWRWPEIEGLHSFGGTLVHSAAWDKSIDFAGKNIGLIGTGSSAIQILPQVRKTAKQVTSFMRSVTWISPPVAGDILDATKAASINKEQAQRPDTQYNYTKEEKQRFREDPEYFLSYRKNLEAKMNLTFEMFIRDSEASKFVYTTMKEEMLRRIGPGHEELKAKLIPSWSPGCRRLTPGDGYLEALVQTNVRPVHNEIQKVVPEGLIDDSGELHKVDIIICATGFNIAFTPPFLVKGIDGVDMGEEFQPEPKVYLGVSVPKFPNYFVINGVRGNWAAGTALVSIEFAVDYILQCIRRIQDEGIKALEVKMAPVEKLYQHIDEWHKRSVWAEDCKSWYKNNIVGGKIWVWAGSSLHYHKTLQTVRWEHYDFRYWSDNEWSFLGNGLTETQVKKDLSRLATYIRKKDAPFEL